jgi:hypothetical protein
MSAQMMLPQTNLQLYRLMMDRGASEDALVKVRAAYDLARRLFVGCHRPSHKPFICHLVGCAGALAAWEQSPDVVVAGLLHSAYLYGNFGDGKRAMTPARQRVVRGRVGAAAESLIAGYSSADLTKSLSQFSAEARRGPRERALALIKLADLCDECADGGPQFSPTKPLEFGLPHDATARDAVLELLESLAGLAARNQMAAIFADATATSPPSGLVTSDRSFHALPPGVDELRRSHIRLRLRRFANGITGKRAA